jgi:hypothetical protein
MYEKLFMTCGESNRDEGETYLLGVYLYVAKLGISVDPPAIKNPALCVRRMFGILCETWENSE